MIQSQFKKWFSYTIALTAVTFVCGHGYGQTVKQLKTPQVSKVQVQEENAKPALPQQAENQEEGQETILPNGTNQSYSVIVENKTTPDGKRIKVKKVWKNGKLVENKEEIIEPGKDSDTSIVLSDGETSPGTVLRSERFGNSPFAGMDPADMDPNEMMSRFERQFQRQRQLMEDFCKKNGLSMPPDMMAMPRFNQRVSRPAPAALSEYWIGASVGNVPEYVAAQLDLAPNTGLLVAEVVPDSPAAKAGLKKYDIITKIGDAVINQVEDIGKVIDRDKEKVQKVEFYRKGKVQTANLTPEKRPEMDSFGANGSETNRQQIRVVRPGMIIPATPDKNPQPAKAESKESAKEQIKEPAKPEK